jgi:hypothetical protein
MSRFGHNKADVGNERNIRRLDEKEHGWGAMIARVPRVLFMQAFGGRWRVP